MEALSLNPLQSGIAAAANAGNDAAWPDASVAGTDFLTLLALGMNADPQAAPQSEKQTEGTAEISAASLTGIAWSSQGSIFAIWP